MGVTATGFPPGHGASSDNGPRTDAARPDDRAGGGADGAGRPDMRTTAGSTIPPGGAATGGTANPGNASGTTPRPSPFLDSAETQPGNTTGQATTDSGPPPVNPMPGGENPDPFTTSQQALPPPPNVVPVLTAAGYNNDSADPSTPVVQATPTPLQNLEYALGIGPEPTSTAGQPPDPSVVTDPFGNGFPNGPDGMPTPNDPAVLQGGFSQTPSAVAPDPFTDNIAFGPQGNPAALSPLGPPGVPPDIPLRGDPIPSGPIFGVPPDALPPTALGPAAGGSPAAFTVNVGPVTAPSPAAPGTASLPVIAGASAAAGSIGPTSPLGARAVNMLSPRSGSSPTKADAAAGAAAGRPGAAGPLESVTAVTAIPGNLAPDRAPPGQSQTMAGLGPTVEDTQGGVPGGTPPALAAPVPPPLTQPNATALANPLVPQSAVPSGLAMGAWAFGFGRLPTPTPQALLTPGIATAANGRGRRSFDGSMIAYAEHRPVRLDVSPVDPETPSWRVDDTQALVGVEESGVAVARKRAIALYSALMDQGEGLAALRPGEGLATWEGSPLWLSLAGIAKPGPHGVLPNVAVPGRVQVQRAANGDWLVEHIGGVASDARPLRHDAAAVDDDSLLSDVLYGVTGPRDESDQSRRFEHAMSALRFASSLAPPARWRSAEAWASVARLCAGSAMHVRDAVAPPVATALQAALSVVLGGLAPSPPKDALSVPALSRERFLQQALSGDRERTVTALKGLGRGVLERMRRGVVDDLDRLDTLALAVCLGRLARTIPQSPAATVAAWRGAGPAGASQPGRPAIARKRG